MVVVDKEEECFLSNSLVVLLADFNSALSGLSFVVFGLPNYTVRIDPKVWKPMLALNGVFFFFTMLNIFSSDAFEWGCTSTSFAISDKRSSWYFPMQSLISPAYIHKISVLEYLVSSS